MTLENKKFFEEFEIPSYEDWKNAAVTALKGAPFEKVMFTQTIEGITLKPIYNHEDVQNLTHIKQDFPGLYPYNRGSSASGFKVENIEISQNIPYPLSTNYNEALKHDLERGQNSIRINFDKAAAIHEDFNEEDLSGCDVWIACLDDLAKSLQSIDLSQYPINIDAGIAAYPAYAALIAASNKPEKLRGTLNFDFITEFVKEGTLPENTEKYISEMESVIRYANKHTPEFKTIGINACEWHNAGANSVQESAIALSLGVFYVRSLLEKGLAIDEFAQKISFSFAVGNNFFMEIAKFRAFRILWSRIIKEFGGNEASQQVHLHAVSSEREHTRLDPYVNILRATSQVFSAITGNCNSITVNHFDKEYGLPSEFSRRIARNTMNVINYESHLNDTIDPAAGSYYIESLTDELLNFVWKEFLDIENNGGIITAVKSNSLQDKLEENFNKRLASLAVRKEIMVGVNKYANIHEKPLENAMNFDRSLMVEYVENYDKFIKNRNNDSIDKILDKFESNFKSSPVEAMNIAIDALKSGAGLPELYNSLPFNTPDVLEVKPIFLRRSSEVFEELREIAFDYIQEKGENPKIDFVCFGVLRDWKARADFSNDFFSVGAFANNIYDGIMTIEDAHSKLDFAQKRIIVVCSSDDKYAEFLEEFVQSVKAKNSENYIILAGYPKESVDKYKAAGVDMFIHVKADIVSCLKELYNVSGLTK